MKKILIISYFFPPCNLTASQRIAGWANYLSMFGYYPTIVTRNWDQPINSPEDVLLSSGKEMKHEKNDQYEAYYLPYIASKRDEIYSNNKGNKSLQKLSKIFTLKDLIFENYSNKSIPFSNMYDFASELITKDNNYQLVLISGNPFVQFKFGYLLHKKFGIKWIADYRDDWNTSELEQKGGIIKRMISAIQSKSEKKWVSTAECITSVSQAYTDKIARFTQKKGGVVLNGFDGISGEENSEPQKNSFHITYNGSLYATQPIEPILKAFKKIIQEEKTGLGLQINFPGLGFYKTQSLRVQNEMKGFEKYITITDRIVKNEVIQIQKNSDVLLMIAHEGIKGIPSSKMYEYIGLKKQILLYPNDHDIIEQTLNDTGLGIICEDEDQIYESLLNLILSKQNGVNEKLKIDESKIEFYSRKNQTAQLAQLLDEVLKKDN